jgi:hypothetical protein
MSANVKTRAGTNPLSEQQKTVAKTHGERRTQRQHADKRATRAATPKKLDQFSRKGAKPGSLSTFGSKASYITNRRFTSNSVPHKRPMHERIENGTAPSDVNVDRPSDEKLLNFLKWIDNNEHAHNSNKFRAACKRHAQGGNASATAPKKTRPTHPTNKIKA